MFASLREIREGASGDVSASTSTLREVLVAFGQSVRLCAVCLLVWGWRLCAHALTYFFIAACPIPQCEPPRFREGEMEDAADTLLAFFAALDGEARNPNAAVASATFGACVRDASVCAECGGPQPGATYVERIRNLPVDALLEAWDAGASVMPAHPTRACGRLFARAVLGASRTARPCVLWDDAGSPCPGGRAWLPIKHTLVTRAQYEAASDTLAAFVWDAASTTLAAAPSPGGADVSLPRALILGLAWSGVIVPSGRAGEGRVEEVATREKVAAVMAIIPLTIDGYSMYDGEQPSVGGDTHRLCGFVAFYGRHLTAFWRSGSDSDEWLHYDDAAVSRVGDWSEVVRKVTQGCILAQLLFFCEVGR